MELEQSWFSVTQPEPGVFAIFEPHHDELVYSYLILGRDRAVLFDTGMGIGDLHAVVASHTDLPLTVVISHGHLDHIGSAASFSGVAEILVHPDEAERLQRGVSADRLRPYLHPDLLLGPLPPTYDLTTASIAGTRPTGFLRARSEVDLGDRKLEVIELPGHAQGQIGLLDRMGRRVFVADAFYPGPLYAHLPGMDLAAYGDTLDLLAEIVPAVDAVYPSHNTAPVDPSMLTAAAAAMREVIAGRQPDAVDATAATHRFEGFSILVPA